MRSNASHIMVDRSLDSSKGSGTKFIVQIHHTSFCRNNGKKVTLGYDLALAQYSFVWWNLEKKNGNGSTIVRFPSMNEVIVRDQINNS